MEEMIKCSEGVHVSAWGLKWKNANRSSNRWWSCDNRFMTREVRHRILMVGQHAPCLGGLSLGERSP